LGGQKPIERVAMLPWETASDTGSPYIDRKKSPFFAQDFLSTHGIFDASTGRKTMIMVLRAPTFISACTRLAQLACSVCSNWHLGLSCWHDYCNPGQNCG